jgi:hypothetical protein
MMVSFVAYASTPNKEVIYSSEASASFVELHGLISQTIEFLTTSADVTFILSFS